MNTHAVLLLGPDAPEALTVTVRKVRLEPVVLSDEAAEVHLPQPSAERLLSALRTLDGFDAAMVPLDGREKRLLLCDMDSTVIGEESLDELAAEFGFGPQVAAITDRAMAGEIAFDAALRERVALLRGLEIASAAKALRERITTNRGAEILVRTMRARGAQAALVTGGFDIFAAPVAERVGFHDVFANRLRSADGVLTGEVAEPILGPEAKLQRLAALCKEHHIDPADTLAVGDGANDRAMVEAAGLGVGYRPKPILAEAADIVLRHADLTALLAIQGIAQRDWKSG